MTARTIADLPLFPLNTVLFPGGVLPLQIFEVRYLHLIGKCRREQSPFGVVSLIRGSEVIKAGAPPGDAEVLHEIGTLARIVEYAAPMPGLMRIRCLGAERFRIRRQSRGPQGLWVADVERLEPDPATAIPPELAGIAAKLGRLIHALQERGLGDSQMPIRPPYELEDCAWVANRWSELLPLAPALRQDLLTQESPLLRLELIDDILDKTDLPF